MPGWPPVREAVGCRWLPRDASLFTLRRRSVARLAVGFPQRGSREVLLARRQRAHWPEWGGGCGWLGSGRPGSPPPLPPTPTPCRVCPPGQCIYRYSKCEIWLPFIWWGSQANNASSNRPVMYRGASQRPPLSATATLCHPTPPHHDPPLRRVTRVPAEHLDALRSSH